MNISKSWAVDAAERVVMSFALTFLGAVLAAGNTSINLTTVHAAALAGFVAALTVVKSLIASFVPGTISPASLVKAPSA